MSAASPPPDSSRLGAASLMQCFLVAAILCAVVLADAQVPPPRGASALRFSDVTGPAGLRFRHTNGAYGQKLLPETLGSGCAFLDADGDGWLDLLLINSMGWPGRRKGTALPALYRNNRNGTFTDITREAGLAIELYGMGVTAADYDNDGDIDVYITALGPNRLFQNGGGGRFVDVTAKAGVGDPGFSTSALWFDYDRDGALDLYVANYVAWSIDKDLFCTLDGKAKSYCTPESYSGQSGTLYRNRGNGTFEDVTRKAGLWDSAAKALGVALIDYNDDDRPDLVVANDTQPNRLYRNNGNGTFADVGLMAGIAFNEAGVARAGMGVDAGDYDGSGRQSIVIGNFANEMMALYSNEGNGLFIDEAPRSTIGQASLLSLTFATFFFDADLDGRLDIFAANGHVADDISAVQRKVTYAQAPHLFRNLGARAFEAVSHAVGPAFSQPVVGRGAAYGDYDRDGDLDLLMTVNNGPARLLRNDLDGSPRVLRVSTVGTSSNRDGIGAKVRLTLASGARRWAMVKTGSSYLSQSETAVTFGLGGADALARLEIAWPTGRVESVPPPQSGEWMTVHEGRGIASRVPLERKPR
jgi:enediyne biosynthesis protein E4